MTVILIMLGLEIAQSYITADYLHIYMDEVEDIFVEILRGLLWEGKVYKPKHFQYGPRKITRKFFKYLCKKTGVCSTIQPDLDPCMFIGNKVIVI